MFHDSLTTNKQSQPAHPPRPDIISLVHFIRGEWKEDLVPKPGYQTPPWCGGVEKEVYVEMKRREGYRIIFVYMPPLPVPDL